MELSHGLYRLGELLCFGIYMHANHHELRLGATAGDLPGSHRRTGDHRGR